MSVEAQIEAAGAQIIYVLEENNLSQIGTAADCRTYFNGKGSTSGWCVGDGQTMPVSGTFDNSPLGNNRGFDIVVVRETMEIAFATTHGTGGDDENITGPELLAEIQAIVAGL